MKKKTVIKIVSYYLATVLTFSGLLFVKTEQINDLNKKLNGEAVDTFSALNQSIGNIKNDLVKMKYGNGEKILNNSFADICVNRQKITDILENADIKNKSDLKEGLKALENDILNILNDYSKTGNLSENNLETIEKYYDAFDKFNVDKKSVSLIDCSISDDFDEQAVLLNNLPAISKNSAFKIANAVGDFTLKDYMGEVKNSNILCYRFKNTNSQIYVTKNGGFVLLYENYNVPKSKNGSYENAINFAYKELSVLGFENMELYDYKFADNLLNAEFVYKDGQTLCLTDNVKISVCLSDKKVYALNCKDYVMHHTTRVFSAPKYSIIDAKNSIDDNYDIMSENMVLLDSVDGAEIRCYEFNCKKDGDNFKVFINCQNLLPEDLRLVDNGF